MVMSPILPLQPFLCPALPTVIGNVDYLQFEEELKQMDEVLRDSGAEVLFVELSVSRWLQDRESGKEPTAKEQIRYQEQSYCALRCLILQRILGEPFRAMSRRLAECPLYQWFCGVQQLGIVAVPSKSQLYRYTDWLGAQEMDQVVTRLLQAAAAPSTQTQAQALGLIQQIELDQVWVDSTCVEANIHFPVDWVLLRDATRSLMQTTALIRKHGLKRRMQEPAVFISQLNRYVIEMTHQSRKRETKKHRKQVLRKMKKVVQVVEKHALRHRDLLEGHWEETDWHPPMVAQVLGRIDNILLQLPRAIEQAHQRIISERPVANKDKILSLYEPDIHVIVRGKAGVEVEFGNTLFLAEQDDGLVVDWKLYQESAPGDSRQVAPSLERMEERFGEEIIEAMGGDRGFDSQENRALFKEKGIFNGLCPRQVPELRRRKHSGRFLSIQRRRAQTEGRIGILKNKFLGSPLKSKGFRNRELAVVGSVLAHNVWVLARIKIAQQKAAEQAEAA